MKTLGFLFSVFVLPFVFLKLRRQKWSEFSNSLRRITWINFGCLGGYLLLWSLSGSIPFNALLVGFLFVAIPLLFTNLIFCFRSHPWTSNHRNQAVMGLISLSLMVWSLVVRLLFVSLVGISFATVLLAGFTSAGTWDDDPENWERAMSGQTTPPEVHITHSHYTRSPHFTYEAEYYFEFTAPERFLCDWIKSKKLIPIPVADIQTNGQIGQPKWFTPSAPAQYDAWKPSGGGNSSFRIYRDRTTGVLFVTDSQY